MKRVLFFLLILFQQSRGLCADNYHHNEQWVRLVQYSKNIFGQYRGRVKKGSFFYLSEDGFSNPKAELEETIHVFKNPKLYLEKGRGHPQCLFPARYRILKRDLKLKLPSVRCDGLIEWKRRIHSNEIAIIYASQFISNPASVMGHTFVKFIDHEREDFLNMAVGYAAKVDDDVSVWKYAYNGLLGGFEGFFSQYPYYEKVHEYNNMERRDLWEYVLKLSEEQQDLFLDIVWELRFNAKFNYFFFDENCSYMLMSILEAVLPQYDLIEDDPLFVVPHETVKSLIKNSLVAKELYRPSIRNKMYQKYSMLDRQGKINVLQMIKDNRVIGEARFQELDVLLDYIALKKYLRKGVLSSQIKDFEAIVLQKRSMFKVSAVKNNSKPTSLMESHGPSSVEILRGYIKVRGAYSEISLRGAVHDFMDKDVGFLPNSAFSFGKLTISRFDSSRKAKLRRFSLADVASIKRYSRIDPQFSWRFQSFYEKDYQSDFSSYYLSPSAGINFGLWHSGDLFFMFEGDLAFRQSEDTLIGTGFSVNYVQRWEDKLKFFLRGRYRKAFFQRECDLWTSTAEVKYYDVLKNLSLGMSYIFEKIISENTLYRVNFSVEYSF